MKKIVIFLLSLFWLTNAFSADLCKAIALRDVAAIENPASILPRGEYDEAITQYGVNKHTGVTFFCSHGGFCYPTHVQINGKRIETLRLTNCKIGEKFDSNEDETFYSVDVLRSKNTSKSLRLDDLDNRFLDMGLCNACAGNVAEYYTKKPKSKCGKLAKQALEGNPIATEKLLKFPDYCSWKY